MSYNTGGSLNVTEDQKIKFALIASLSYESDPGILEQYNLDVDIEKSDYQSMVLYDTTDVYISIRGSNDLSDFLISDVGVIVGRLNKTPRYRKEGNKLRNVKYKYSNKKINVTGHSLGGTLALNLVYNYPLLIDRCVVFNPGFSYADLKNSLSKMLQSKQHLINLE